MMPESVRTLIVSFLPSARAVGREVKGLIENGWLEFHSIDGFHNLVANMWRGYGYHLSFTRWYWYCGEKVLDEVHLSDLDSLMQALVSVLKRRGHDNCEMTKDVRDGVPFFRLSGSHLVDLISLVQAINVSTFDLSTPEQVDSFMDLEFQRNASERAKLSSLSCQQFKRQWFVCAWVLKRLVFQYNFAWLHIVLFKGTPRQYRVLLWESKQQ